MNKKRVLSGIRATGRLHLGNYLGAVKGMLELQNPSAGSGQVYETFYMVADVHTITTPYKTEELRKNRREVIIDYLSAGLNPNASVIFQQSEVAEHLELAFFLSSVVTIAKMQHLPTFKDKVKQYPQNSTMALLNYPILMAADILIYKAELVPVGIDQEPHLEVAREIARRFNTDYGTNFPEPKRFVTKGEYVPSLTGEGKMSKTVEGSYINLTDTLDEIKGKIARIPTDSGLGEEITGGVKSLMELIELFISRERREMLEQEYKTIGIRYGDIKSELSEAIFKEIEPIQKKRAEFENDPALVDRIINEGNEKAREAARETIKEVKEKMGLS